MANKTIEPGKRQRSFKNYGVYSPYESHDGDVGWTVQKFDPSDDVGDMGTMIAEFNERADAELFAWAKSKWPSGTELGRKNSTVGRCPKCGGTLPTCCSCPVPKSQPIADGDIRSISEAGRISMNIFPSPSGGEGVKER